MKTGITALFFLLLAVPFHAYWQDYEVARRGLLVGLCGLVLLELALRPRTLPRRLPAGALVLLVWFLLAALGLLWAHNPGGGLQELCYFMALWLLLLVGCGPAVDSRTVLRGILPAGTLVGALAILQGFGVLRLPDTNVPVSTLGNLNVASEFLTMSGVAAALLVLRGRLRGTWGWLALGCLLVSGFATAQNDSLSGRIALPAGCALACLLVRPYRMPRLGLVVLLGILPSVLSFFVALLPQAEWRPPARTDWVEVAPSTTDVRLLLWRGTVDAALDRPIVGHGVGQFDVVYPLYRRPEELEISTGGRRYPVAAESAHNDYLEALAETGLLGGVLLLGAIVLLVWGVPFWSLAVLVAFGFHAGVRAPIGNAPAAAFVFLFLGSLRKDKGPLPLQIGGERAVKVVLGALLLWVGVSMLVAQFAFTGYIEERRKDPARTNAEANARIEHQDQSLRRALWWNPHDARLQNLAAEQAVRAARQDKNKLPAARKAVDRAGKLWPHHPENMLRRAMVLKLDDRYAESLKELDDLLKQDPGNPEAALMAAVMLTELGKSPEGVHVLYRNLHPRLRERLAKILGDLHAVAQQRGMRQDADFLYLQQLFVQALDALEGKTISNSPFTNFGTAFKNMDPAAFGADMRFWLLNALRFLSMDKPDDANGLAARAQDTKLSKAHRRLIGEKRIQELVRRCPKWAPLLR